jgi:uncharacterized membrane protein
MITMNHRQGGDFPWQDGPRYAHDAWWYGPLHVVLLLLLIALLVVGVVWLVRRLQIGSAAVPAVAAGTTAALPVAGPAADPALAALRLRYARGEVSRDDYLQAIEDLTGAVGGAGDQDQEDTQPIES